MWLGFEVVALDAHALAGRVLHDVTTASGGFSGETFAGLWFRQRAYVRLYLRDPGRAAVDLALMRRLEGVLPLAKVLGAVTDVPTSAGDLPAHIVTAAVPGQRGDTLLEAGAPLPAARAMGRQGARVVSVLRQVTFDAAGPFTDRTLTVGEWPSSFETLVGFSHHLRPGLLAAGLDTSEGSPLMAALAAADARRAAAGAQRPCLVHGDLNGKNLVLNPNTGRLRAVLDWEHAHAGSWLADAGNLLRGIGPAPTAPALAFREGFVDALHEGLLAERSPGSSPAPDWPASARDHDLFAVLELAARPTAGHEPAAPVAAARDLLRGLRTGG